MPEAEPKIAPLHTRELRVRGVAKPRREPALAAIRYGSYALAEEWEAAMARDRHIAFLRATSHGLSRPPILSHGSASAVLHLPTLGRWRAKLEQIVPEDAGRSSRYVIKHRRSSVPEPVVVDGFLVTPAARTIVDLAAQRGFAAGVVAADHGLRTQMCTHDELVHELELMGAAPGCRAAREAVEFADPLAESPGESLKRARLAECGFQIPELQVDVRDRRGYVGRVDFLWREAELIGEFDGLVKYGRQNPDQPPAEEVVWEEKLREDRLRSLGFGMVRTTWAIALSHQSFSRHLREHGAPELPGRRRRDR